jgi:sugar lactone lactonase YvrE
MPAHTGSLIPRSRALAIVVAASIVGLLLAAVPPPPAPGAPASVERVVARKGVLKGTVEADGVPVEGATVRLMRAGATPGTAEQLRRAITNGSGSFVLRVPRRVGDRAVLYITARGGRIGGRALAKQVELAASLASRRTGPVVVNEITTVAAGFSLAQFAERGRLGGANPGLRNAATMPRNLVEIATGEATRFLRRRPNGNATETLASFNSLASIVAGCAAGSNDCGAFLDAATDAWGTRPRTTWQAMTLLPQNPSGDPGGVFDQIPADPRFEPVREAAPDAWVIALRFYGNGHQFNGPGNVAFDDRGRVWSNNNAEWSLRPKGVCPGKEMFLLDPYAPGRPMTTFRGGGLNGAGFGIGFDPRRHLWIGNFGFTGSKCPKTPTSNSVSEFRYDGKPLSHRRGYRNGPLSWPQGTKSDVDGNIWIANCGNDSLVVYPDGKHRRSEVVGTGIPEAFDVAQNTEGNIFVTANTGDQVYGFVPEGDPLPGSPFGGPGTFEHPLGAASDSLGNVWVSNSGVIKIPCSSDETLEVPPPGSILDPSVVKVGPDGSLTSYEGGGLTIPWGIAVDGDDNIWVANFTGQRLSHLCGARAATCPPGAIDGAISRDTGYPFDGLQRNTGVQVDPSGNVWLTNNWIKFPVQTDPFGDGLVVYLGMAAPVRTPLIGTPQRP